MNWPPWALLSALFAGATAVLAKIGVENVNSHLATALRTTVILVFAWAIALAVVPLREVETLSRRTWLFLALSGVATGLSWLCYFRALQLGGGVKGRADRQAQRGFRAGLRGGVFGRVADLAHGPGRRPDRGRCDRARAEVMSKT